MKRLVKHIKEVTKLFLIVFVGILPYPIYTGRWEEYMTTMAMLLWACVVAVAALYVLDLD